MNKVTVRDLAEKFHWKVVVGEQEAFNRPVKVADTNRPGLELTGYFPDSMTKRLVIIGEKESKYIEEEMDQVSQRRAFEFLTSDETPAIVVCHEQPVPESLIDISQRKNFPVFTTKVNTSQAIINVTNYLDEQLAESMIIHGELMRIFGVGVLITGRSGMGKSEIALELVKKGHQIIADDRVDCYHIHNGLIGRCPELLQGYMEMRGIGVIDVTRMYGVSSFSPQAQIRLHLVLEPFKDSVQYDRVGIEEKEYTEIFGVKILKQRIPVSSGRPMSTIIETAVTNYLLMQNGIDSAKEFEQRVISQIEKNKEEEDDA